MDNGAIENNIVKSNYLYAGVYGSGYPLTSVSDNRVYGILLDGCSDVTIKNNRVEGNYLDNPDLGMEKEAYVNEVCGIYFKNSDNNILSKNTVKDINMRGIDFYSSEAYGIYIDSSSNDNVISNCTIEGNYI